MAHKENQDLLDKLARCRAACEHCADACLSEDKIKMLADCIRTDRDCADICGMAEAWVARDSGYASELLTLCATVCDACAEECEKHDHDHCRECAKACRECAEACRNY